MTEELPPRRPMTPAMLTLLAAATGPALGGFTNVVNGLVSPDYFVRVMGWSAGPHLLGAIVTQGFLEGACIGLWLAAFFGVALAIITKVRAPLGFGIKHLAGIALAVLVAWTLGGLVAIAAAALNPESYQAAFPQAPTPAEGLLGFAWVGGSIWGLYIGALPSLVGGLWVMRRAWAAALAEERGRPAAF